MHSTSAEGGQIKCECLKEGSWNAGRDGDVNKATANTANNDKSKPTRNEGG